MPTVKELAAQMDGIQEKIAALEERIDSHEGLMERLVTAMTQTATIKDLADRVAAHETPDRAEAGSWYHW